MAEEADDADKTEEPSERKLEKALEKGDVARSQEVSTFFLLGGTLSVIAFIMAPTAGSLITPMKVMLAEAHRFDLTGSELRALMVEIGQALILAILVPCLVLALAAIAGNLIQHKFVWSVEGLKPKLSKISLIQGFKRIFGLDALVNFVKGLFKISAVAGAIFLVVWPRRDELDLLVSLGPAALLEEMQSIVVEMTMAVLAVVFLIAGLDYMYQRARWMKKQMMSRQELKEEYKEAEGSPEIKAKVRQLRQERSRRRMMAEVPNATVVVTNPTHYAVALKYDAGMQAPLCVAKGVDALALKIRETADKAGVPIMENPPLARALHASVEINEPIPEEHYRAVAEVIGFVMRQKKRA
jgi:flagellar biosynthetic protein FlhB